MAITEKLTIEKADGIGTLTLPVEGEEVPSERTGSYLPAVSSYQ